MDAPSPLPSSFVGRTVLGSFLSALAGWAALVVFSLGAYFLRTDDYPGNDLRSSLTLPIYAGFFIVPVWFIALLPLYCFVPPRSTLWRWPVCTLCGAVAGGAIMAGFFVVVGEFWQSGLMDAFAALVGGTTCLFGSLTQRFFRRRPVLENGSGCAKLSL